MDSPLTLAHHYARLIWLLRHASGDIEAQKTALRLATVEARQHAVRLHLAGGRLAVNDTFPKDAEPVWRELEERFEEHRIEEVSISREALPAELLAIARLLASEVAADATEDSTLAAVERLATTTVRIGVSAAVYEALALDVERAACGARGGDVADGFTLLLDREHALVLPEARVACGRAVRRLTRPTTLRTVARLLLTDRGRAPQVLRILERCGADGVEAVVDQILNARTSGDRIVLCGVVGQLSGRRSALLTMLDDDRWFVACLAAELLAGEAAEEDIKALADLKRFGDGRVRRAVLRALATADGAGTTEALLRGLADSETTVRLEAVSLLTARGSARVCSEFGQALEREDSPEVLHALLGGLGRIATPDAVHQLSAATAPRGLLKQKKHPGLRVAGVAALSEIRLPSALTALKALANDREREVREAVGRVLVSVRYSAA